MIILCLNCGSSSVKYSLFDHANKVNIAVGLIEKVGYNDAVISQEVPGKEKYEKTKYTFSQFLRHYGQADFGDALLEELDGFVDESRRLRSLGRDDPFQLL